MRVIGGELRRRRLLVPPGLDIRPTPDRLREALFNILAPEIKGRIFLDAYAGTGAVGIEALSRGAARAIFIEASAVAIAVIKQNLEALGLLDRAQVVAGRVEKRLARYRADIVFLDPPYALESAPDEAMRILAGSPPALVIVQHHYRRELATHYGCLWRVRLLRQGENALSFYRPGNTAESPGA